MKQKWHHITITIKLKIHTKNDCQLDFNDEDFGEDTIVELEERIEDAKLRKSSIEMGTITLDNIYKLMLNFGKLYDIISDEEKKSLITYLIKEIQIYPNGESEQPLKSIEFNFPIYRNGQEVRRLLWEKGNTVETVFLLSNKCLV